VDYEDKLYELVDRLNVSIMEANTKKLKAVEKNDHNGHIIALSIERAYLTVRRWVIEEFMLEE